VEVLPGGVSNDVLLVKTAGAELVVKQALPRLRVAQEWLADRGRIAAEGAALRLAATIRPDGVPAVADVVAEDYLLVMERAPAGFSVWKDDLLAGRIDVEVAGRVGSLIGSWHAATLDDRGTRERFDDLGAFVQLRVDPYYYTAARRHPAVAGRIGQLASSLLSTRRCLVHGDLSPKNVLSGRDGTWVIDWEVAHFGDPAFDLAFVLCHLRCKAAHRPAGTAGYRACARAFLDAYEKDAPDALDGIDPSYLAGQVACLLLARIDGKSPVEYLGPEARARCRSLACNLLSRERLEIDDLWADEGSS